MNPISAYINALNKYFDYRGRSSRREYWMFMITTIGVQVIGLLVLFSSMAAWVLATEGSLREFPYCLIVDITFICYLFICFFAFALPGLALMARRLNDMGWSRWLLLVVVFMIPLPPFVFFTMIIIILFGCIPSRKQVNDPSTNEL